MRALGLHFHLALVVVCRLLKLGRDCQPVALEVRLWRRARPARLLCLRKVHHGAQPLRRVLLARGSGEAYPVGVCLAVFGWLVAKDGRAREANAAQHLERRVEEGDVVHGLRELQVSKVTRALRGVHAAARAVHEAVDGAERRVHEPARDGLAILKGAVSDDIAHRRRLQLHGTEDAKLDAAHLAHARLRVAEAHAAHGGGRLRRCRRRGALHRQAGTGRATARSSAEMEGCGARWRRRVVTV